MSKRKVDIKQLLYGIAIGLLSLMIAYLPILLSTPEKSTFNWEAEQMAQISGFASLVLMLWSLIGKDDDEIQDKIKEKPEG